MNKLAKELLTVAKQVMAGEYDAWHLHRVELTKRADGNPKNEAIAAALAGSYIESSVYVLRTPREDRTEKWVHELGDANHKGEKVFNSNLKKVARKFKAEAIQADWSRGLVAIQAKFENEQQEEQARKAILAVPGVMDVHFTLEHALGGFFKTIE